MDRETILYEALRKDTAAERGRFLDQMCGRDTPLRDEIESLLVAHEDAGSFLEETHETAGTNCANDGAWRALLGPSNAPEYLGTLGQYQIVEFVGRGGMGVVLRAHDPKLNRMVAIKLLAPTLATDAMAVRRFLREARAAAAVSHDHVTTIFAVDELNRPPFIVMEFIDGPTLQQKIEEKGALKLKEILRIGSQIAAGLAAAHRQGVIHRDVKPANILLENGIEKVKISDFGLARAVDDVSITRTGQISGTPQFMSPEQIEGSTVDARSDLFSLGSVIYTLCTGRPPFRADSAVATFRRVCDDTPRLISELNSEIPYWLEDIVRQLLAKDPADRYQSADEVAQLLRQHLAQQQTSSPTPLPPVADNGYIVRPKKGHRTILFACILAVTAIAISGWCLHGYLLPGKPHRDAVQCSFNGHWYVVVNSPQGISWEEANQQAQDMGGHLVTVTDEEENDFVIRLLKAQKYWHVNPIGVHNLGPWLGAFQLEGSREPDGGWRWITGEEFTYSAWHIDDMPEHSQPNEDQSPYKPQLRIVYCMRGTDCLRARWGDATDGRGSRSFIVEFDDLPAAKSHSRSDPYGSIVIEETHQTKHIGVNITNPNRDPIIADFARRYTVFVAPGSYQWRILDLSLGTKQQVLAEGTIEIEAGQRVTLNDRGDVNVRDE